MIRNRNEKKIFKKKDKIKINKKGGGVLLEDIILRNMKLLNLK